jgi:hypothetical protein
VILNIAEPFVLVFRKTLSFVDEHDGGSTAILRARLPYLADKPNSLGWVSSPIRIGATYGI